MISDAFKNILFPDQGSIVESAGTHHSYIVYLLVFSIILAWRLWTFTLRPLFYPDELDYFPYWIPCKRNSAPELTIRLGLLHCIANLKAVLGRLLQNATLSTGTLGQLTEQIPICQ
jgi:hypothetical protein